MLELLPWGTCSGVGRVSTRVKLIGKEKFPQKEEHGKEK
jgi:hypothetical protein